MNRDRHKNKKKIILLLTWFPILYYWANIYRMSNHSSIPYIIANYVVGSIGIILLVIKRIKNKQYYVLYCLFYIISISICSLINENINYIDIFADVLLLGITFTMLVYPVRFKYGVVSYYVSVIVFVVAYQSGMHTHYVLTSSGNYISVLLILSCAIYYFGIQNEKRKLKLYDLVPGIIDFILSIWARGRGGILSCTVFLVLLIILYIKNYAANDTKKYLRILLAVIIVIAYMYFNNVSFINAFLRYGKWATRGVDNTARLVIWDSYFNKMNESFLYFLFGVPLREVSIISNLNNNTHNSFLQLHAYAGIFMSVVFVFSLIKSFCYEVRQKNGLMCILMVVMVIRGMSDKFIFGQYGMPIMLYLIMHPYFETYISNKIKYIQE